MSGARVIRFLSFYNLFRLLLFENTNVTFIKIITSLALADSRTTYKLYYTVHKAAFSVGLFEDRISTLSTEVGGIRLVIIFNINK